MVLDTNLLVAAGFRAASASGRLVTAARSGQLLALWTPATRAEAEQILRQIPPLAAADLGRVLTTRGRVDDPLALDLFEHLGGRIDQTLAALAATARVPLVTADGPLREGARAVGVAAWTPAEAVRALDL